MAMMNEPDEAGNPQDPVEVVQQVVPTTAHARAALTALHEAGWRLARVDEDWEEMDDDPDSPTHGRYVTCWAVTEEWSP